MRDAWMAQVFADLDQLLARVDELAVRVDAASAALRASAAVLDAASARYRSTVAEFTAQAKAELARAHAGTEEGPSGPDVSAILNRLDAIGIGQRKIRREGLCCLGAIALMEVFLLAWLRS